MRRILALLACLALPLDARGQGGFSFQAKAFNGRLGNLQAGFGCYNPDGSVRAGSSCDRSGGDPLPAASRRIPAKAEPEAESGPNPRPWKTSVRIRVGLGNGVQNVGSGTIIYSDLNESIVLTCGHIFREGGPASAPRKMSVDLFDGIPAGPKGNQVRYVESHPAHVLDFDAGSDVGLVKFSPGRTLPYSRVVPTRWAPREGMVFDAIGCSNGTDPSGWRTKAERAHVSFVTPSGDAAGAIECDFPPSQGRSGGGLFTSDGYIAGVCVLSDTARGRGLYAEPTSIHRLLDRCQLAALYSPPEADGAKLASGGAKPEPDQLKIGPDAEPFDLDSLEFTQAQRGNPTPQEIRDRAARYRAEAERLEGQSGIGPPAPAPAPAGFDGLHGLLFVGHFAWVFIVVGVVFFFIARNRNVKKNLLKMASDDEIEDEYYEREDRIAKKAERKAARLAPK